jgi:hypothetical protein
MAIISSEHGKIEWRHLSQLRRRIAPEIKGVIDHSKTVPHGPDEVDVRYSHYSYLVAELADDEGASLPGKRSPAETHALLKELADKLAELHGLEEATGELPAVYTYFGQFLNHDISAPLGSIKGEFEVPQGTVGVVSEQDRHALTTPARPGNIAEVLESVVNQHRWPMTLHSLYGDGPFEEDEGGKTSEFYEPGTAMFKLGKTIRLSKKKLAEIFDDPAAAVLKDGTVDLLRDPGRKIALIADRRNDENLIISQLHLAIMLFHNNTVERLKATSHAKADVRTLFEDARRLAILHYQWCIVHDFLEKLLDREIFQRALADTKEFPARETVPMEFAAAVFRFGHSMVSSEYNFNDNFRAGGRAAPAGLDQLFEFTSKAGMSGLGALPDHWIADWTMLTGVNATAASKSDRIDAFLVGLMLGLPDGSPIDLASIARSNLWRGFHRRIPSGQALADAMGVPRLSPKEIADAVAEGHGLDAFLRDTGMDEETPAWLYVLCEAMAKADGNRLGPLASSIVAKTIFGLLRDNEKSVLRVNDGTWSPEMDSPLRTPAGTPITDIRTFLQFAKVM